MRPSDERDERDRARVRLEAVTRPARAAEDGTAAADRTPDWLTDPGEPPGRFGRIRGNPGRRGTLALAGVAAVVAVLAIVSVVLNRPVSQPVPPLTATESSPVSPVAATATVTETELVVSVVGKVVNGGLVRLPPGSRVADAIAAAGGATDGADLLSINMAQRVADGDQILLGGEGLPAAPPPTAGAPKSPGAKVNLNNATEAELDGLPGVGPVTATAIVAWRTANGRFTDVAQLGEVDGIGPARLAKLRELVTT